MSNIICNKARCRKCNTTIESTHRHDFQACSCGSIFVDGGKDYIRRGAADVNDIEELSEFAPEQKVSVQYLDYGRVGLSVRAKGGLVTVDLSKHDIEKLLFDLDCAYAEMLAKDSQ